MSEAIAAGIIGALVGGILGYAIGIMIAQFRTRGWFWENGPALCAGIGAGAGIILGIRIFT